MKKLVIAVIVLSFLGFGPLKSFFHSESESEVGEKKSIPILEKLKDSSENEGKIETFLIMEKSKEPTSSDSESGMLLKYDKDNKKMEFGWILVPMTEQEDKIDDLKNAVKDEYQVDIDYCVIFDTAGIGNVIDLIAPNGIEINTDNEGHLDGESQTLNGKDFVLYLEQLKMNPSYSNELSPIFLAIKEEIMKEMSAEKILTLAPQVLNETLKSINTDLGKGKLMDLGLSVMLNPVTTIERIELMAVNQKEELDKVNKLFEDEQESY